MRTTKELIEALTKSGAGRKDIITSAMTEHPEYFGEDCVISALIAALGDRSLAISALALNLLMLLASGDSRRHYGFVMYEAYQNISYKLPHIDQRQLIDTLKQGFDPAGNTAMKRRLMLICTLAGAEENDWYLSLLGTAKKDIRAFTVFALGETKENVPLLLQLVKKERGRAKEMAYRALGRCDTPEARAFWQAALENEPQLAAYLSTTALDVYGDLAAGHLQAVLETILDKPKIERELFDEYIAPYLAALTGKGSEKVAALYQWVLGEHARFPYVADARYRSTPQKSAILSHFHEKLCETLTLSCPPALVDFLEQQAGAARQIWGRACFLSDLFTHTAAEVYERWGANPNIELCQWLRHVGYSNSVEGCPMIDPDTGNPLIVGGVYNASLLSLDSCEMIKRPIKEPLDWRWIEVFMKNDWQELLQRIDEDALPPVWREKLGAYLYKKILQCRDGQYDLFLYFWKMMLRRMHRLGWTNYQHIMENLCMCYPNISEEQLSEAFAYYRDNAGEENTWQEALRVLEFYRMTPEYSKRAEPILTMLKDNGFLKEV